MWQQYYQESKLQNELQKDKKKHFFVNHKNIFSWNTTDLVL